MTDRIRNINEEISLYFQQERFRTEVRSRAETITPEISQQIGEAYATNPNVNPQIIAAMVLNGADRETIQKVSAVAAGQQIRDGYGIPYDQGRAYGQPNGPVSDTITGSLGVLRDMNAATAAQAVDDSGEEGGDDGVFGWLHRGFKGAVRGAMLVSQSGWQATEAFIKGLTDEAANVASGRGFQSDLSLGDVFRNTSLYEAYRQQRDEGRADLGEGFFVGGTVAQNQAQRQKELLGTVTLPGGEEKIWNAGLGFARALSQAKILPYNDAAWNVASGVYSAVGAITFDPLNAIGAGIPARGGLAVANLDNLPSRTAGRVNAAIESARLAEQSGDTVTALRYNQEALQALGIEGYLPNSLQSMKDSLSGLDETRRAVQSFLRDEAGFISAGGQRTLMVPEFVRYLTKDDNIRAMQYMADETDALQIWKLHKGKIGPKLAQELANSSNIEDVLRTYAYALGNPGVDMMFNVGYLPEMGFLNLPEKGLAIRNKIAPYSRWFNYLPEGSVLGVENALEYMTRVYDLYTNLPTGATRSTGRLKRFTQKRYDIERRDEMLRRAIAAFSEGDATAIKNLNSEMAADFERMFIQLGWSPTEARQLTLWSSERDRLGQFSLSDLQNPTAIDSAPLMVSQLLQSGAAIIDPAKLREVLRGTGRVAQMRRLGTKYHRLSAKEGDAINEIAELESLLKMDTISDANRAKYTTELNAAKQKQTRLRAEIDAIDDSGDILERSLRNGAIMRADDFMSKWWKPLTLVRAAYILRIVPEEIARITLGGVFGSGPGAFMDYMFASMGDINTFGGQGRYTTDVLGVRFSKAARNNSDLAFKRQDLLDEIGTAKLNKDDALVAKLTADLDEVTRQLDESDMATMELFDRAMLSHRDSAALQTVTREVQGASVTDRRLMSNMSGNRSLATKSIPAQRDKWVEGLSDYYVQAMQDTQINRIARVAAGRSLPKTDRFAVQGFVGNWDEHVAAGRIVDERQGIVFWMQSGSRRNDLERLINAYAGEGRILDPNNFNDVAYIVDRQIDHLATLVGGKPADSAFSPATLGSIGPVPSLYKMIDNAEQDLLEAIATGKFDGSSVRTINKANSNIETSAGFQERLKAFADTPNAPERVLYSNNTINGQDRFSFLRDRVATPFFTKLYGIPSDKLSRSPAFRRFYWAQMEQLVRSANDDAAYALVAQAQRAGLPDKLLNRIVDASKARTAVRGGGVDLATLDEVAKGAALAQVKELLYDASRRGSGLDQMRLIAPFGDAWKEVWQFWGKELVRQRGMPVKKLAKGVEGVREAGLMEQDPITGEWHVEVPLSAEIARLMPGIANVIPGPMDDFTPGPFTMPAQSLNVLGTFSPGVGPVFDRFVNSWIPDDPRWDTVRDWFFPVAEPALPDTEAAKNNLYQSLLFPSPWMRRGAAALPGEGPLGVLRNFVNDVDNDPAFQATLNHVVQSLASSRPASETQGADNMQRLFDDANKIARRMYFLRGVFAFMGPGAPMPSYVAETGQGNLQASLLTDEWRRLEQALLEQGENPGMASQIMIDVYGPEIWLYTSSNSNSTVKGAQSSDEWWDWYRSGGDELVDKYPLVGAYLGDIGDFSIDAYGSLFARGIYTRKTGDALYEEAATDIAFLAYNRLRDQFPPEARRSPEQRRVLASVRESLQKYWGVSLSGASRIEERDKQIREFTRLLEAADTGDELASRFVASEAGQMLAQYMALRQVFSEQSIAQLGATTPTSFRQMRAAAPFRDALREMGAQFSAQNETFGRIYRFVLEGELFDDEDQTDLSAPPVTPVSSTQRRPGQVLSSSMLPSTRLPLGG